MSFDRSPSVARGLAGLLALAGVVATTATARADWMPRGSRSHATAEGNLVEVSVEVDGRTVPLYFKPGTWDRNYFEAQRGRNYSLVLHNTSSQRVGLLLAVDGLNVVNGLRSRLAHDEPMYVLGAYETATIRGWRTSLDEVRRFVFVDEENSYAERTDQASGDLGWIRVLSFQEQEQPWRRLGRIVRPYDGMPYGGRERDQATTPHAEAPPTASAPSPVTEMKARGEMQTDRAKSLNEGPAADATPGTGWGDRRHDPVNEVEFTAERNASDQLVLRYEYASGLRALGIFPRRARIWERERGELGFALPPRH